MAQETVNGDFQKLLETLSKRQDQHIEFMNSLERIRWQFTSAFGIAAILSLFFLSTTKPNSSSIEQIAATILILTVSAAGLITQIRIVGLFWNLWDKILTLQNEESDILKHSYAIKESVANALLFPKIVARKNALHYFFTVHIANCAVFSSIIGLSMSLALRSVTSILWLSIIGGVLVTLLFVAASYAASMYFYKKLE